MAAQVHEFLRAHVEEILRSWESLVTAESHAVELQGLALRDSLPTFLDALASWLESGAPPGGEGVAAQALSHVMQRLDQGVGFAQFLREYRLLRETILRAALREEFAEQRRVGPTGDDDRAHRVSGLARLNAGLDVAFSDSIELFVAERDRRAQVLERAVRDNEARLRAIVEPWVQAHWETDAAGSLVDIAPSWTALTGQTVEEAAGKGWLDAVHPDDRAGAERRWREALATRRPLSSEFRLRRAAGGWHWTNVRASPIADRDGTVRRWVGINFDIGEQKAAEEALRASEEQARARANELATVLDAVPAAVWISRDPRGDRIDANRFGADLLKRRLGENVSLTAPGDDRPRHFLVQREGKPLGAAELPIQKAARGEPSRDTEIDLVFEDGEVRHLLGSAVPLRDELGAPSGSVGAFVDVTDRKRAEEDLRRSDRQKSEFLAVLSHELRNPLAPLRNSIYLLERAAPGSEQAARARDVLRRQTDHLTRLVDDLLDLTRISRGKTELRQENLDLREVVKKTTDDLRSLFEQSDLELRVDQPAGPIWVNGDSTRLAQLLGNLLQNAVKFTPAGGAVAVRLGAGSGIATLSVRDTGAGMQPGTEQQMFEAFAQGAQDLARTRGGLGLGLALVKAFTELHGGTVRATSEGPGRGSEFVVSIPLSAAPAPGAGEFRSRDTPGRRILIVEDNVDAAETLGEILQLSGHDVRLARDAREGLQLARELAPDVILCDVGLPDMDGYEFARAARREPSLASTRLVAVTGYAQPEDRERARQAGFDAHVPKPPALDQLEMILACAGDVERR